MANVDVNKVEWNTNEKRLLKVFRAARGGRVHLSDMAKRAFGPRRLSKEKANSWARNSLRRFVRFRLVKKVDRGTYEFVASKGSPKKRSPKKLRKVTKPANHKSAPAKQAETATETKASESATA